MIEIRLNLGIYSVENIKKTCLIYDKFAEITLQEEKDYMILNFSACKYSEELTIKEFENYLIGVENM